MPGEVELSVQTNKTTFLPTYQCTNVPVYRVKEENYGCMYELWLATTRRGRFLR